MAEFLAWVLYLATLGLGGSIFVSAAFLPIQDRGCSQSLDHALAAARRLHSYYDKDRGMYSENYYQWTDSNALEDVQNIMLLSGSDAYTETSETSYLARAALDPGTDWSSWLGKYNDDTQWHVLSLWRMSDYKRRRGADPRPYLAAAERMYDIISAHWDDECGGGLWWTTEHAYKNAITNEQFLLLSAAGYLRNHNQTYLGNAKTVWQWLRHSGMRNHRGLFNDGLNFTSCHNNGQTTWTYNQGLVASGLGALSAATGDKTLLDEAEITLDATIAHLTTNGILRETCDKDTNEGKNCDGDQQIFKGLWTKHLMYYLEFANEPHRVQKYSQFLSAQSAAIHHHATNITSGDIGSVWYTPNQAGSIFSYKTVTSGLAAHIAAAKYGAC
ncbi:Meiotically Up-regulated protein [Pleurotus pulmonarius]